MDISIAFCLLAVFLLLLVVILTTSIRIVQEDTRLAVYRLGRYVVFIKVIQLFVFETPK